MTTTTSRPSTAWQTAITEIRPNRIQIRGFGLAELIRNSHFSEVVYLLLVGTWPDRAAQAVGQQAFYHAVQAPADPLLRPVGEDSSKYLAKCLLMDTFLPALPQGTELEKAAKCLALLGRVCRYISMCHGHTEALAALDRTVPLSRYFYTAIAGHTPDAGQREGMVEALILASVDHGVTPPSTQATRITASVRAPLEVSIAAGISAITDVHGGAGADAVTFFRQCTPTAVQTLDAARDQMRQCISEYARTGTRIKGLGHRIHTRDPRVEALWQLAADTDTAGLGTALSQELSAMFLDLTGKPLPINVDGVIGAIAADMGFAPEIAKLLFVIGRIAGLAAHYFEEIATQPPMRQIVFSEAVYSGMRKDVEFSDSGSTMPG